MMPRYDYKKLRYDDQDKLLQILTDVLLKLRTKKNTNDFLKDVLNRSERIMIVRRLLIARFLDGGRTYDEIQELLKVGRATIARTERWLNFGRGGLKNAIRVLKTIIK